METLTMIVISVLVIAASCLALYEMLGRSKWDGEEWTQMRARDQWMTWLQRRDAKLPPPTWHSTAYPSSWTESEKRFADGDR